MGSKVTPPRVVEVQTTPRLVPVSYNPARVISSDDQLHLDVPGKSVASKNGERTNVKLEDAKKSLPRFVYLFATGESLEKVAKALPENTLNKFLLKYSLITASQQNVLFKVLRVDGVDALASRDGGEEADTPFGDTLSSLVFPIAPDLRFVAFGTPHLLTKEGVDKLAAEMPEDGVIELNLLSKQLPSFDAKQSGQENVKRVLPVVDPLVILRGTTQKYNQACDAFLRHTGDFQARVEDKSANDTEAEFGPLAFFRYQTAQIVTSLTEEVVSNAEAKKGASDFINRYESKREELRDARELAALHLIRWLESDSMTLLDELLRDDDGAFVKVSKEVDGRTVEEIPYELYAKQVAFALARLIESDRGRAYLSEVLSDLDSATGSRQVIRQFLLREDSPDADTAHVARSAAAPLFSLWGSLFPLITARITNAVASYGSDNLTTLNEVSKKLCQQIAYLFDAQIFDVVQHSATEMEIRIQDKLADINVEQIELKLNSTTASSALKKVNVATETAEGVARALNAALAIGSIREAVKNNKYDLDTWNSTLEFAQSLVFFGDKLQANSNLTRLRQAIFGVKTAKVVTARLAIVGAVFDLAAAGPSAIDAYQKHDWNKSFAEATKGAAAVGTLAAIVLSGPASLVAAIFGLATLGASIWSDLATDSRYDKLVKFSYFGNWSISAKMDKEDRAWTVAKTFVDWNPNTKDGLETHQQAANQMQFSFRVAAEDNFPVTGPLASDGDIRISVAQLLPNSILHLKVDSDYVLLFSQDSPSPPVKDGHLWISFSEGLQTAQLHDESGHFETKGALVVKEDDGQINVLVHLRLKHNVPGQELNNMTVRVRLDVLGDGNATQSADDGSIVVPTTAEGKRWVEAKLVEERSAKTIDARSFETRYLA